MIENSKIPRNKNEKKSQYSSFFGLALLETGQRMALMAKYGINCRRKIEPCWTATGTIIPTTNNSNIGYNNQWNRNTEANATLWTIIYNFQRENIV